MEYNVLKRKYILVPILAILIFSALLSISVSQFILNFKEGWIIIIGVIVLVISIFLMQHLVGLNIRRLTIPSFFWWFYIAMIFIPSFFIFFEQTHFARWRYIFAVQSVLLTVPLGILFANALLKFKRQVIKKYFEKPINVKQAGTSFTITYLIFFIIAITLTLMYMGEVKTVPLFHMFKHPGEYYLLAEMREASFKLLDSPLTYAYSVLRVLIYPFLIMISLGYYLYSRQKKWLFLFLITLITGVMYASFSLAKMPVAAIFLNIFLFLYLYKGGKILIRTIIIASLIIFTFPISVILLLHYGMDVNFFDALVAIAQRIFYFPSLAVYYYFEYFPNVHDHLYGRSIGKLAWLMGWEYFNTPNVVGRYAFPQFLESINMNSAFIGDLNADFGIFGVLLGGFFAGFLMQGIQIYLLRQRKTILNVAVYTYLMFAFWLLNSISLPVVLASNGVIFVLILPWLIKALQQLFEISTKDSKASEIK